MQRSLCWNVVPVLLDRLAQFIVTGSAIEEKLPVFRVFRHPGNHACMAGTSSVESSIIARAIGPLDPTLEPSHANSDILVKCGHIRFNVEQGCLIDDIDICDMEDIAFDFSKAYD